MSTTEKAIQRMISRVEREHSSYKHFHAEVHPDAPHLYDLTLYWHLLSYEDNLQIVHCPYLNETLTGSLSETPLLSLLDRLCFLSHAESEPVFISSTPSLPQEEQPSTQALSSCSSPSFVFTTWRGETRSRLESKLNHLYRGYEQLKQAAKVAGLEAVLW